MKPFLSVIICAHNPRRNYLDKVLRALQAQTLPLEKWELLLVDNASDQILSSEINLGWHPQSRHIREEKLGLTPARLRGIKEAVAETLVFVDDDNVLDSDYLEVALRISKDYPFIGAWGGQIKGEFEVPPPEWAKPYLSFLAIREFQEDKWSNLLHQHETTPCGAGLCIRKFVANKYAEMVSNDSKRLDMDRKGNLLMSCGDSDLAFTACDLGLGTGQFTRLKLTHLMPASRLEEAYLVKLIEGIVYSNCILNSFRGKMPEPPSNSFFKKLIEFFKPLKMKPQERRIYRTIRKSQYLAYRELSRS